MKKLVGYTIKIKAFCIVLLFYGLVLMQLQFAFANEKIDFSDEFDPTEFEFFVAESGLENLAIKNFYTERSFNSFWYGNSENIDQLINAYNKSVLHGLPKSKYDFVSTNNNMTAYEFELSAMTSFIELISDLRFGSVVISMSNFTLCLLNFSKS